MAKTQMLIRVPPELRTTIRIRAAVMGLTISEYVQRLLEAGLSATESEYSLFLAETTNKLVDLPTER